MMSRGLRFLLVALTALIVIAAITAAVLYHQWRELDPFAPDTPHPLLYLTWPWPSGMRDDPHDHQPALFGRRELLPLVTDRLAVRQPREYETYDWVNRFTSPDHRYEVRQFVSAGAGNWYVKDNFNGGMLMIYEGTTPERAVWSGDTLTIDAVESISRGARLHFVIGLDEMELDRVLLLK